MSQLFDYFVCSRPTIEKWTDAMEQQDEERQQQIESEMARFVTLKNIGQDELNILAGCVEGDDVDAVNAVCQVDLVKAFSEEEGPWVMAFRQTAVEAIAGMTVGMPLVHRWVNAVAEFHGSDEDYCGELLTADAAMTLKQLCKVAVERRLGVFTCFYG